eukprot:COSAG02_NODE_977_length_15502_cov_235.762838_3_plen_70_part_00
MLVLRCANGATVDAAVPLSLMCGQDGPAAVTARSFHEPRKRLAPAPPSFLPAAISSTYPVPFLSFPGML